MVSTRSGKSMRAQSSLSILLVLPLKQFQCWCDWRQRFLSYPSTEDSRALALSTPLSCRWSTVWCPWPWQLFKFLNSTARRHSIVVVAADLWAWFEMFKLRRWTVKHWHIGLPIFLSLSVASFLNLWGRWRERSHCPLEVVQLEVHTLRDELRVRRLHR